MLRGTGRIRPIAMLCALLCALVVVGTASTAAAAPYTKRPTIAFSQTNPCAASQVTVKGQNFQPRSNVSVKVGTRTLGTATVASNGTFTLTTSLPSGVSGRVTVTAAGGSAANSATSALNIAGACAAGAAAGPNGGAAAHQSDGAAGTNSASGSGIAGASAGPSGLSSTGVAIFALLAVALALLVAGSLLVLGGRRRRTTTTA
ncbi:IPT/TIG domain-containing protein [uncultured Jatrophihabitans sp.]|uniref:IPT/TIG domain-containing protein n=1 Tax=uncultured Jatrophihabitans sp. TaxID=1610747 RepID=UPI0035CAAF04